MAPSTETPTERLSFLPDFPNREFLYYPLDAKADEIRVITIQPCEDYSSAIHCILQTISIQDGQSTVPYDAISYFWGSTATTENIIVYDKPPVDEHHYCCFEVPVTLALTGALRHFRATMSGKPLVLWTDAVCINQRDLAERSQQVLTMRKVFEAATSVLAWLGEGDPVAELGLVNIFGLLMCRQCNVTDRDSKSDAFDYYEWDVTAPFDMESIERVDNILKTLHGSGASDRNNVKEPSTDMKSWILAVSALMDLTYWHRGWTVQEACANNQLWLQYGNSRCRVKKPSFVSNFFEGLPKEFYGWMDMRQIHLFARLYDWMKNMEWARLQNSARATGQFLTREMLALNHGPTEAQKWITKKLVRDLVALATFSSQTSDPRDQVYSRVGSATGFMLLGIKPDYTLTTVQVFIATTIAILHESRSWAHAQFFSPSESPFMPSWAIDFTVARKRNSLVGSPFSRVGADFRADAIASFRLQESGVGRLFTASFIQDDIVVAATSGPSHEDVFFQAWPQILVAEETRGYIMRNPAHSTLEDLMTAYYRTLCMGVVEHVKFGPEHSAVVIALVNNEMLDGHKLLLLERMTGQGAIYRKKGMKLIITRKGHLGLAAHNVNVGDRIAILATGSVPFVLQTVSEQDDHDAYVLLGACYVDGETFALQYKDQRYCLRINRDHVR
jgi:hypothetical protein